MPLTNRYNGETDKILRQHSSIPSPHSSLMEWLKIQRLGAIQKATEGGSSTRSSGRPALTAERWTSLEFVRLCHSQGWSNVQMANSGSESQKNRFRCHLTLLSA